MPSIGQENLETVLDVLLSTYGLRGDAEPMVGLAVQSRALGAAAEGCDALWRPA